MAYVPPQFPKRTTAIDTTMTQEDQRIYVIDASPVSTVPINVTLPDAQESYNLSRRFVLINMASVDAVWHGTLMNGHTSITVPPQFMREALPAPNGSGYCFVPTNSINAQQELDQDADIASIKGRLSAVEQSPTGVNDTGADTTS